MTGKVDGVADHGVVGHRLYYMHVSYAGSDTAEVYTSGRSYGSNNEARGGPYSSRGGICTLHRPGCQSFPHEDTKTVGALMYSWDRRWSPHIMYSLVV